MPIGDLQVTFPRAPLQRPVRQTVCHGVAERVQAFRIHPCGNAIDSTLKSMVEKTAFEFFA